MTMPMTDILTKLAIANGNRVEHSGELQATSTGYVVLQVPNAMVRGQFMAMSEPGIELPPGPGGRLNAHITVFKPHEVQRIGGAAKISERGKHFSYRLGPLRTTATDLRSSPHGDWHDVGRLWYLTVHSPQIDQLRKSYGLEPTDLHVTVAVRRRNVLRAGEKAKTANDRLHASAVKAAAHLRDRQQGGRDHVMDGTVCGGDVADRARPGGEVPSIVGSGSREKAGQGPSQGSVDVGNAGRGLEMLKLARPSLYATTMREAVKQVVAPKSQAQADAGNYKKGHIRVNGLDISIETPKGKRRKPEWPPLNHTYGYIKRTLGKDGDHVDVFLSNTPESGKIYVVDQVHTGSGEFDEHKCMVGFPSLEEAKEAYLSNYEQGWQGMGTVTGLTWNQFKAWIKEGDQTQPMAEQTARFKAAAAQAEEPVMLIIRRVTSISLVAPESDAATDDPDREDSDGGDVGKAGGSKETDADVPDRESA